MSERQIVPFVERQPVKPTYVEINKTGGYDLLYSQEAYAQAREEYHKLLNPDTSTVDEVDQSKKARKTSLKQQTQKTTNADEIDNGSDEIFTNDKKSLARKVGGFTVRWVAPATLLASGLYGGTLALLGEDDVHSAISTDVTLENVADGWQHVGQLTKAVIGIVR